jgi:protein SCO1/2
MNETAPLLLRALLSALLALAIAGCSADPGPPPLAGARMGGPFTLTAQDGRRVSSSAFDGKYRLVYFGYTFCPDVCPMDMQMIGAGLRQFEQSDPAAAARVQPIFITTDPARDTPQVLRQFVSAFHPRFIGLTGSADEIADVARAYGVYYERRADSPEQNYLLDHNRVAVLYGPQGEPIVIIPEDQGPAGVAQTLEQWVR